MHQEIYDMRKCSGLRIRVLSVARREPAMPHKRVINTRR